MAETGPDLAQDAALRALPRAAGQRRTPVRRAGLRRHMGDAAGLAALARIARLPGIMPVLEIGYRLFLPVRPLLSRLAAKLGAKPRRSETGS